MDGIPGLLRLVVVYLVGIGIAWAQPSGASATQLVVETGAYSLPDINGSRLVALRIRATDGSGRTVVDPRTNVMLHAYGFSNASLVVSEVARDYQQIEFTNPGDDTLNLANWSLRAGRLDVKRDSYRVLAAPALLPPGGVFRWRGGTNSASTFPELSEVTPLARDGLGVIEVRNDAGELVDQVVFSNPGPVTEFDWTGRGVSPGNNPTNTWSRLGDLNRFQAFDWIYGPSTLGRVNPQLNLPWRGSRTAVLPTPLEVILTNGVWQGTVQVPVGKSRRFQWAAGFGDGWLWDGALTLLPAAPALALEIQSGSPHGSEASPGIVATVRVRVPIESVADAESRIALSWSAPGEFDSVTEVVIPAGQSVATFAVRSLDDAIADGRSRVRLTARLAGFSPAEMEFTLDDNESGTLHLSLPGSGREGAIRLEDPCWVTLPAAALHDTEVELVGEGRLQPPARLLVPAGALSAQFSLRILDDPYLNKPPMADRILAITSGWPPAVAPMAVIDDERASLTLQVPLRIVEGIPGAARVEFHAPFDRPVTLRITSSPSGLEHPSQLIVEAGTKVVEIPLAKAEDSQVSRNTGVRLVVEADGIDSQSGAVGIIDNDSPVRSLSIVTEPVVYSNGSSQIHIALLDDQSEPAAVDGRVQLRIVPGGGNAALAPGSTSVPLVAGRFDGEVQFTGSSPSAVLEAVFQGLTNQSSPFDLTPGRIFADGIADVARWPGRTSLLALRFLTNDVVVSGQLVELDPYLGRVLRQLDLPQAASRIAVADNGAVAWLGSVTDSLQRIDLTGWKVDRELSLGSGDEVRTPSAIAISPGSTDDVAAIVLPSRLGAANAVRLVAIRGGRRLDTELGISAYGFWADVVPGRGPGEFYAVASQVLRRVILDDTGFTEVSKRDFTLLQLPYTTHPVLTDAGLLLASGQVVNAETLEDLPDYSPGIGFPPRTAVAAFPELNLTVFANETYYLVTYDARTRTEVARRHMNANSLGQSIDRLVHYGDRGLAVLAWGERRLFLVDDAPRVPGKADLSIGLAVPAQILAGPQLNQSILINALLSVTNHGPEVALDVSILYTPFLEYPLGTLQPGEVRVLPWSYWVEGLGRRSFPVSVRASTVDPVAENNSVTNETILLPPEFPNQLALDLPARHLVSSPDGNELWLAVGPEAPPAGIAVLDPRTGVRLRTLPVGDDPQRMAFTPDARAVYVLLGTNRLVRWNIDASAIDFDRQFSGDIVKDFVSLPEPRGRLAVLNRAKLTILEGNAVVQSIALPAAEQRAVGVQGGRLWVAWQENLRAYRINAGNLTAEVNRSVYIPSDNYRFVASGNELFFDGRIVNVTDGERSPVYNGGAPWIPAGEFAYNAQGGFLRRHRMSDLNPDAEVIVPGLGSAGSLLDQVRWGTDGFAFRTEKGVLISVRSPVVRSGTSDLAITIEVQESAYYNQPVDVRLVVTNRGPESVNLPQLKLQIDGGEATVAPGRPGTMLGNVLFISGDPIPVRGSFAVALKIIPTRFPLPTAYLDLQASVMSESTDPTLEDTVFSKTVTTTHVAADIGVQVASPAPSDASESVLQCVVTNRGPGRILGPGLSFTSPAGLTLISVDRGTLIDNCCGAGSIRNLIPSLAAGESVTVKLVVRNKGPGIYPFSLTPDFIALGPQTLDKLGHGVIQVPGRNGQARFPGYALPFVDARWSVARNEWILSDDTALYRLATETLELRGMLQLPSVAAGFHLTDDGQSVWVPTDSREARRYSLETGDVELTVQTTHNLQGSTGILIPHPSRPGIVIVAGLDDLGQMAVTAYDNGVALPVRYIDDLQWMGRALQGVATPDSLVYFSNGQQLRELEVRADGLHLRRNLDAFNRHIDYRMAVADGLLIQGSEEVLDLATLKLLPLGTFARPSPGGTGYQTIFLRSDEYALRVFDLPSRRLRWEANLLDFNGRLGAGGAAGAVLLGINGGWLPTPPNPGVDLQVSATLESTPLGIGQPIQVNLQLRQSGVWKAHGTKLTIDLPPGLELIGPAANDPNHELPLPEFTDMTTMSIVLQGTAPGTKTVRFKLTSDVADPSPEDAIASLTIDIPEEPVLLLTDQEVSDHAHPLIFRLSAPAPRPIKVQLMAELIDAQAEDLTAMTYDLDFPTGAREAAANWIAYDTLLEPDERFRIRMVSGELAAVPALAVITIVNRDRVQVVAASVSQAEGNINGGTSEISVQLAEPAAFPLEIGFRTFDVTALGGEDYQAVFGHLFFSPGQRTNRISVPIMGDLRFEPNEVFGVDLFDNLGLMLPSTLPTITLRNDDAPAVPQITLERDPTGHIAVSFTSEAGVLYSLQSCTNLIQGNWARDPVPVMGTGGPIRLSPAPIRGDVNFYRVRVN